MKRVMWVAFLIVLSFIMAFPQQSLEEEQYLAAIAEQPLIFSVPKEKSEEAWGRIQSFIANYSSMKIQMATDYVIQTYNPTDGPIRKYGYEASRTPKGEEVEFKVHCTLNNTWGGFSAKEIKKFAKIVESFALDVDRNARILAYFARTGEVMPKFISHYRD